MEFAALSRLTGDPEYEVKAHHAMDVSYGLDWELARILCGVCNREGVGLVGTCHGQDVGGMWMWLGVVHSGCERDGGGVWSGCGCGLWGVVILEVRIPSYYNRRLVCTIMALLNQVTCKIK